MQDRTGRLMSMIVVIVMLVCVVVVAVVGVYALDLHAPPAFNYGINALYEDGSFIVSLSGTSIAGCLPVHIWDGTLVLSSCSGLQWIGIDTPWEDIFSEPVADVLYYLTGLVKANNGCPC